METPLITEDAGSPITWGRRHGHDIRRKKPPASRSDAIAYGSPYQKAAALVDLAEDGIGLPEEVLNDSNFGKAAKFYFTYIRFDILWSLNLLALLVLNFLEKPLWCISLGKRSCEDREYFFLGQLPYLTSIQSYIYEVFGGLVNSGNPKLESTDLADSDYLLFNFNDYPNGMVTLFNLLVMGNWQAWMQSYKDLTGTYWALAYFISFYLITILLLLNLVLAFVLEAFFAEQDLQKDNASGDDDDEERKERRRRIGIKSRSRIADNLLHRILSNELSES